MTLIARIINNNHYTIYLGDALICNSGIKDTTINTPIFKDANSTLGGNRNFSVSGLRQKVVFGGDNIIFAWSGDYHKCSPLMNEIIKENKKDENYNHFKCLKSFLGKPKRETNGQSLLCTFTSKNKDESIANLEHFHFGCKRYRVGQLEVRSAGSGTEQFITLLDGLYNQTPPPKCKKYHIDNKKWFNNFSKDLHQHLCLYETTGGTIFNGWGGAFEFAYIDCFGKFTKYDNYLFVYFEIEKKKNKLNLVLKPYFYKYNYIEQHLWVQELVLNFENQNGLDSNNKAKIIEHNHFISRTSFKKFDIDLSNVKPPDYSYKHLCLAGVIKNENITVSPAFHLRYTVGPNKCYPLLLYRDENTKENEVNVFLSHELIDNLNIAMSSLEQ